MSEFRKLKYGNAVCVLVWSCIRMLGDALTMRLKSRTVIEAVRAGPTDQSVKSHLPQRQLLQAFCSVVICRKWPIAEEQFSSLFFFCTQLQKVLIPPRLAVT